MKKLVLFFAIILFSAIGSVSAQGIGAFLSHATFNIPGESPFVEVYMEIMGNTLVYKQLPSGKFQGSVQVTMIVKQDSVIKDFKKYELLSDELTDTTAVGVNFIDQQRFKLPNGNYTLELSIADNNVKKEPVKLDYPFEINFPNNNCSLSTIQLINSYTKTVSPNVLSKSGYDLVPLVDNFYPSEKNKLIFYCEIYNPLFKEGLNEGYLVAYYIESFDNHRILNEYARTKRETSKPVMVVLNEFDITNLPTGNYNLVVEVKNKENKEIAANSTFFQKSNPAMEKQSFDFSTIDLTSAFSTSITNADTLKEFIQSLNPISTEMEKMFIKYQSQNADLRALQQFFEKFWETRDTFEPRKAWETYKEQVAKVNRAYGTQVKKGYDTDMGYVYLKYGEPSVIQDVPFETSSIDGENSVPYQIWQYYSLSNGKERNKRFVFINSEVGARDYTLVHSDVKGEIQNYNWQTQLIRKLRRDVPIDDYDRDMLRKDGSRSSTRYFNPY
ncbi:MAG TPA: GWxTD domain-containing protein [Lentimicrobium sp.]|nr:GWxTD domain-containing protein [Lentimicrobium sp.]